ncbi:hypothetical protein C8Q77DRAFT_805021 [Trametes polyzona]|nr:hypothetical protein C8Q77DRAFT_805021 [Trametes polyzona]
MFRPLYGAVQVPWPSPPMSAVRLIKATLRPSVARSPGGSPPHWSGDRALGFVGATCSMALLHSQPLPQTAVSRSNPSSSSGISCFRKFFGTPVSHGKVSLHCLVLSAHISYFTAYPLIQPAEAVAVLHPLSLTGTTSLLAWRHCACTAFSPLGHQLAYRQRRRPDGFLGKWHLHSSVCCKAITIATTVRARTPAARSLKRATRSPLLVAPTFAAIAKRCKTSMSIQSEPSDSGATSDCYDHDAFSDLACTSDFARGHREAESPLPTSKGTKLCVDMPYDMAILSGSPPSLGFPSRSQGLLPTRLSILTPTATNFCALFHTEAKADVEHPRQTFATCLLGRPSLRRRPRRAVPIPT